MTYKVEINPDKENEFLQLLRAWQSLEVVRSFKSLPENSDEQDTGEPYMSAWERLKARKSREIGEEYRDLVD
ncbi:MAG: hypothetical protein ACK4TA_10230 [Saprospiraceae bacterium]